MAGLKIAKAISPTLIDTPLKTRCLPLTKYLNGHIRFPQQARTYRVSGWVVAILYVGHNNTFTNAKILRGIGNGCDEEVRNQIMDFKDQMPKLPPGEYLQPVFFGSRDDIPPLAPDIKNNPNCLIAIAVTTL